MLKQRVITAVVLLLVLLPALFASDTRPFFGLTLLFIAAAGCGRSGHHRRGGPVEQAQTAFLCEPSHSGAVPVALQPQK